MRQGHMQTISLIRPILPTPLRLGIVLSHLTFAWRYWCVPFANFGTRFPCETVYQAMGYNILIYWVPTFLSNIGLEQTPLTKPHWPIGKTYTHPDASLWPEPAVWLGPRSLSNMTGGNGISRQMHMMPAPFNQSPFANGWKKATCRPVIQSIRRLHRL
jgi:hypothetical protein